MKYSSNGVAYTLPCLLIIAVLALIIFPCSALARGVIYGPETFVRSTGKPVVVSEELSSDFERQAVLRVMNGGHGTPVEKRLSSAWIRLNGIDVVNENNFSHRTPVVEVPVTVFEGANSLEVEVASVPGGMITVEIVSNEPFIEPAAEVLDAAQLIHEEIPGARVTFSQLHGHVMLVQTPGFIDPEAPGLPEPLASTRGTDEDAFYSAMIEFLERFKTAYMIDEPALEVQLPRDPSNEFFNGIARDPNDPMGVSTLRLVQTYRGLRISGRHAIGMFDPDGNLQGILTRILPVPGEFDPKPVLDEAGALTAIGLALEAMILNEPSLYWLRSGLADAERAVELLWIPAGPRADSPLRLAYEVQLRNNVNIARVQVDARTGVVIRAFNETPSDWYDDGEPRRVDAPNETGFTQNIVSTLYSDTWYMGFGETFSDPGLSPYFNAGELLSISDTSGRDDLANTYSETMTIGAAGGYNTWATDPTYMGGTRAATSLMKNLRRTLEWWQYTYGWRSWDGRGSTLWSSINNNRTDDGSPQFNAWGGSGVIQIGDGTTEAGETLAMSLEVVGHEFMHNVLSATSRLIYNNESGAVNEALADFFGAALTVSAADRFNNSLIGELPSGASIRNMQTPMVDRYSNYIVTSSDSGGVHTNSGILNKAHWHVVMGGTFRGISVDPIGVARTASMLKAANQLRLYPPGASMEEYAASIVGYCDLRSLFARALGGTPDTTICTSFRNAYRATQLLHSTAGGTDIALDRALIRAGYNYLAGHKTVAVDVTNRSLDTTIDRDYLQLQVADELGEVTLLAGGGGVNIGFGTDLGGTELSVPCYDHHTVYMLGSGETLCTIGGLPTGIIDGYLTGIRRFTLEAVVLPPYTDPNTWNNWLRLPVGPDYIPRNVDLSNSTTEGLEVRGTMWNLIGGFPVNLKGVYLTRSTAHGPLSGIGPAAEDTLETAISPGVKISRISRYGGDRYFPTGIIPSIDQKTPVVVELIELPGATRVPGTSQMYETWFDSAGGLAVLEGRGQYYMLADSRDMATEVDETNNLMCINCYAPEQDVALGRFGVIVRLPNGTPVESIFPLQYLDAARKLRATLPRTYNPLTRFVPSIGYRYVPSFPAP